MKRSNRSPLWRPPVNEEVQEEMEFHLEMRVREYLAQGLDEETARRKAQARFGDAEVHRAECRRLAKARNRHWRLTQAADDLYGDLRFALRQLARRPLYALTLLGLLAVGLGATTAVLGLVSDVLLRPPPYEQPERLVTLWEAQLSRGKAQNVVSPANFMAWRDELSTVESMAAFINVTANLGSGAAGAGQEGQGAQSTPAGTTSGSSSDSSGDLLKAEFAPQRVRARWVTSRYFEVLGVPPRLGRHFGGEDIVQGASPTVVIGHRLWQQRFGGAPDVLGQIISVDGAGREVVGILPPRVELAMGADFSPFGDMADLYLPLPYNERWREPRGRWMMVVGRLAPGVSVQAAQEQLDLVTARQLERHPSFMSGWSTKVVGLGEHLRAPLRAPMTALLGAVALVLLIVCINASNLLLGRTLGRLRELQVRSALGAGGLRIVRQLLSEALVIAGAAGLAGWWVARGLYALGRSQLPNDLVIAHGLTASGFGQLWPVALGLAAGSVLLLGLLPAIPLARSWRRMGHSRSHSEGVGLQKLRSGLIFGQMVFALVLLVGAGLMLRTVLGLLQVEPGFQRGATLSFSVAPPSHTPYDRDTFYERLLEQMGALPGVSTVGAVSHLPLVGMGAATGYFPVDRAEPEPGQEHVADIRIVDGQYFAAMGIERQEGRSFDSRDRPDGAEGVAVVSRSVAERLWPEDSALGQGLKVSWGQDEVRRIVGVVSDVHQASLAVEPRDTIYFPREQEQRGAMTVVLGLEAGWRADEALAALAPAVRDVVRQLDSSLPIFDLRTIDSVVDASLAHERFLASVLFAFAVGALLLAAMGIYGVTALRVRESRREIGVRMALGAAPRQLLSYFLQHTGRLALAATLLGVGLALALGRTVESLLYGVEVADPLTIGLTAAVLLASALLATLLPALQASRFEPSITLREE